MHSRSRGSILLSPNSRRSSKTRQRHVVSILAAAAVIATMGGTGTATAVPSSPESGVVSTSSAPQPDASRQVAPLSPDSPMPSGTMPPRPTTETGTPLPGRAAVPSETMPPRPESDGPNANAPKSPKETGGPEARALPGCEDFWNPEKGRWFMVCGRILAKYIEFNRQFGKLGLPTSDELTNPDGVGKRTSFTNDSSIYWSPASDAHQIGGAIGAKWCALGCEGTLGYPTSDELTNPDGVGKRNSFMNDISIYWIQATGAQPIGGAIGARWGRSGYEGGRYGYPTTGEFGATCGDDSYTTPGRTQSFQASQISWTGAPMSNFIANEYGSVMGGKIRYQDNSTYYGPVAAAKVRWNQEGRVILEPNTAVYEVIVKDANMPDVVWVGLYTPISNGADFIELNKPKLNGKSSSYQAAVAMHEFGHAMRMRHICPGEVMAASVGLQTPDLQEIDLALYHAIWG